MLTEYMRLLCCSSLQEYCNCTSVGIGLISSPNGMQGQLDCLNALFKESVLAWSYLLLPQASTIVSTELSTIQGVMCPCSLILTASFLIGLFISFGLVYELYGCAFQVNILVGLALLLVLICNLVIINCLIPCCKFNRGPRMCSSLNLFTFFSSGFVIADRQNSTKSRHHLRI